MNHKISDIFQNLESNTNIPETSLGEGMAVAEGIMKLMLGSFLLQIEYVGNTFTC